MTFQIFNTFSLAGMCFVQPIRSDTYANFVCALFKNSVEREDRTTQSIDSCANTNDCTWNDRECILQMTRICTWIYRWAAVELHSKLKSTCFSESRRESRPTVQRSGSFVTILFHSTPNTPCTTPHSAMLSTIRIEQRSNLNTAK